MVAKVIHQNYLLYQMFRTSVQHAETREEIFVPIIQPYVYICIYQDSSSRITRV